MAKKKSNFDYKKFFLEKGEHVGAIAAGAALLLMLVLAIVAATGSKPSDAIAGGLKQQSKEIESKVRTGAGTPNPLPEWVLKVEPPPTLAPNEFVAKNNFFDPIDRQESKRINPRIFPVAEFQADLVRGQIRIYDIIANEKGDILVGVIKDKAVKGGGDIPPAFKKRFGKKDPNLSNLLSMMGGYGGMPGMGGPGMGGPPGGFGNPPSGPPGGFGNPPSGPGMPPSGRGGPRGEESSSGPGFGGKYGGLGGSYNPNEKRNGVESVLDYVDLAKGGDLGQMRMAEKIMPRRMVMVSGSFPYKQQVDEYRRALRFQTYGELYADPEGQPLFTGFLVQRRVRNLEGDKVLDNWKDLDYLKNYAGINARKVGVQPEDPKYAPVVLPIPHRAVLPNPLLSKGQYPDVKLPMIEKTLKEITEANKIPVVRSGIESKLRGLDDPYNPNADGSMEMPKPGDENPMPTETPKEWSPQDAVLVRFLDVDVQPGYTYDYRVAVKMANPNYKKNTLVSQPSMAEPKDLTGPWAEMPPEAAVRVPEESHLYAMGYAEKETPKPEQTKIQVQTWMETMKLNNVGEPVGDWVVSHEMPVTRGEYIGKKQILKLPLWSAQYRTYVLREKQGATVREKKAGHNAGVEVDFSTRSLLVDFDGGKTEYNFGPQRKKDDSATELLILTDDGRLIVRNSGTDRKDPDREARQAEWEKWIKSVEDQKLTDAPAGPPGPGNNNPFQKGGTPAGSSGSSGSG